jgi:hypothetical protein
MKKSIDFIVKIIGISLIFTLLFSTAVIVLSVNLISAQTYSTITIRADGSVEGTSLIQRRGTVYTFTGDIFGTITVKKANITIDGRGHILQGNGAYDSRGIDLFGGYGESCYDYSNVLVKNLRFCGMNDAIYAPSNNNSFINNRFEERLHIIGGRGSIENIVKHNIFVDTVIFVDYNPYGFDVITENDFIDSGIFVSLSKPPIVDRNYWNTYVAKYPDANEIGKSGIWDTPYDYDMKDSSRGNYSCIDYTPLVNPVGSFNNFDNDSEQPNSENDSKTFSTIMITATVFIVVISTSLLIYFIKHKNHNYDLMS